ncbi:MAG: proline iminopeptidase-family hydrolase [Woeseiaceae bacterium]
MKKLFFGLIVAGLGSTVEAATPTPGEGFVNVPGGPVWYKVSGNGAGLPLLVLHGGPGGTSCGQSRLEVLGDERPIIRYDQLGTGRSGRPEDINLWQADLIVERLHALRTALGLDNFHIIGHSWGGALAAAYVIAKGTDGIASVTLSSPLLSTPDWIADANYLRTQLPENVQATLAEHEAAGTVDSDEYQEASRVFYERHIFAGKRQPSPADCDGVTGNSFIYQHMWGPTEFYATGNLVDFDVTSQLHEIDVPVLLMAGEFDEARPERLAQYQQLMPGSRLEIIAGAAHASLSKEPEEYRAILESFLDSVEAE